MYKLYYEDDFEVKINIKKKTVEIYAWRKFSHDIEKDTQLEMGQILQQLDMQQILDKQLGPLSIKIGDIIRFVQIITIDHLHTNYKHPWHFQIKALMFGILIY